MAWTKILLTGDAAELSATAAVNIAGTAAAGTGLTASKYDHIHVIGAAAISATTMFGAGAIGAGAIAASAISSSAMFTAGVIVNAALAASAVASTTIANSAVIAANIAASAIASSALFTAGVVPSAAIAASAVGAAAISQTATDIAFAQLILTPAATAAGTVEGSMFYDSDDNHVYVYVV